MKKIMILIVALLMLTSCAESQLLTVNGKATLVEPYGWANSGARKVDGVQYQTNLGNVVISIIFVETIFVPIWLTGWELFEPVYVIQE